MAFKPSICTMSLGRCFAGHSLKYKLQMASKYGFQGIELFYEDLAALTNLIKAAHIIRSYCNEFGLELICLQPFMHYEGLLDRALHRRRLDEMRLWVQLAHILGTDLIMLPSSNLPSEEMTTDMDLIVSDMVEIADIGARAMPPIRFAYEALCWGTRVDTWEGSWDIVQKVNRRNFGICLDTFNIAGRIYADPLSPTGRTQNCDETLNKSLECLVENVPAERIFLLQVADGERLSKPLTEGHEFYNAEQPSRMSWSRNARLFYGESRYGGYLPVQQILHTLIYRIGWEGWLSLEVFNRALVDTKKSVPEEMANRAAQSWECLKRDLRLEDSSPQIRPTIYEEAVHAPIMPSFLIPTAHVAGC
ncbi:3-dehydroshikimate dehydratase [Cladobotryum mycophilum]|uniref:3-dehydroshikimate dehydratase n=1 Tax=Cladobotryum mycophilum TaxID=491253 RepID=A0ABR0S8N7_9HYPO